MRYEKSEIAVVFLLIKFSVKIIDENSFRYECYNCTEFLGSCSFNIAGYIVSIDSVCVINGDSLIAEGLIRSSLKYASDRMSYICHFKSENFRDTAYSLGFVSDENDCLTGEIPELLKGNCCKGGY